MQLKNCLYFSICEEWINSNKILQGIYQWSLSDKLYAHELYYIFPFNTFSLVLVKTQRKSGVAYIVSLKRVNVRIDTPFSRKRGRCRDTAKMYLSKTFPRSPVLCLWERNGQVGGDFHSYVPKKKLLPSRTGASDGNVIKMYFLRVPIQRRWKTRRCALSCFFVPLRVRASRLQEAKDRCIFLEARWNLCHWNGPDRQVRTFVTRASNTSV